MRRLLAVSWEMPPMYGPRATQVSRTLEHLGQLGWESTVVCLAPRRGGPHWPDGRDPAPLGNVRRVGVPSREESLPVRAAFRLVPSLRRWPDSERLWVAPAARAAIREASAQPPLGFVTFAQPWSDHLVGTRIRHSTSLPWVAHFSDPWTDSPYLRVNGSQRRAASRMEAEVIRQADAIVFVNGQTADLVMRKFPASWRHKAHVVPHGFDRRRLPPAAPREPGPLRLVYTGRFYRGIRTPLPLLRALADLDRAQPLGARLAVQFIGPQVQEFEAAARELGV
ncbi:MAG TPA: glycosyltransferase, partial [Candidatus Elarobacter sp.]|nr:glycosyltransferase [Candidatus Elarobacter sp.]